MASPKVIAVIGATGAQGLPVIKHLLESKDGVPSPWKVRALTRDPSHKRANHLVSLGVELVVGSFLDSAAIHKLFDGVYGAFVNTDSSTVGEAAEINAAFNIWEIARFHKVRHYVWSNLDYSLRISNYNPIYGASHMNTKGRFGDFLASQPNEINVESGTMWSNFTTGPYMDMLNGVFGPFNRRADGTFVFASPTGEHGRLCLIALDDLGWWARYIFDNAPATTGRNIALASQMATFPEIVEAFRRATGQPAVYVPLSLDEWFALWNGNEVPVASDVPDGKTWEQNFRQWYSMYNDGMIEKRDMEWIASIHPPTTVEKWMRDSGYTGVGAAMASPLKRVEDKRRGVVPNVEAMSKL